MTNPKAAKKNSGEAADSYFAPPNGARAWRCARLVGQAWEGLTYELPDGSAEVNEWPIAELSVRTLRERWGPGCYRVIWIGSREGKRVALGKARPIVVKEKGARVVDEAQAAAASASTMPAPASGGSAEVLQGFNTFMAMTAAADERASRFYSHLAQLDQNRTAMMFEFLRGAISPQAIAAAVGPAVKAAVAEALPEEEETDEEDDDEEEEDDDEPPPKNPKEAFTRGVTRTMTNVAEAAPEVAKGLVELGKDAVETWKKKTDRANMSQDAPRQGQGEPPHEG